MTPDNIERLAIQNSTLPKGLKLPEQLLFLSFRCLHQSFRARQITREQAHAEKLKLLDSFDTYMRWDGIYQDTCKMRVELGGISREMVVNGCPLCKKAIAIFDGRQVKDEN